VYIGLLVIVLVGIVAWGVSIESRMAWTEDLREIMAAITELQK